MKKQFCSHCGHIGNPKKVTKGSALIEIFLWLTFIFPGIIYSLWRVSSRYQACEKCESTHLMPPDSPMAKQLIQKTQEVA